MGPVRLLDGYQSLSIHYLGMHPLATGGVGGELGLCSNPLAPTHRQALQ